MDDDLVERLLENCISRPILDAIEKSTSAVLEAIRPCEFKKTFDLIEELRTKNLFTSMSVSPAGDWKVEIRKGERAPDGTLREAFVVTEVGNNLFSSVKNAGSAAMAHSVQEK